MILSQFEYMIESATYNFWFYFPISIIVFICGILNITLSVMILENSFNIAAIFYGIGFISLSFSQFLASIYSIHGGFPNKFTKIWVFFYKKYMFKPIDVFKFKDHKIDRRIFTYHENVMDWLDENTPSYAIIKDIEKIDDNEYAYIQYLLFRKEEDAMLFTMTWKGTTLES